MTSESYQHNNVTAAGDLNSKTTENGSWKGKTKQSPYFIFAGCLLALLLLIVVGSKNGGEQFESSTADGTDTGANADIDPVTTAASSNLAIDVFDIDVDMGISDTAENFYGDQLLNDPKDGHSESCPGNPGFGWTIHAVEKDWNCGRSPGKFKESTGNKNNFLKVFHPTGDLSNVENLGVILFMRGSSGYTQGYDKWLCATASKNMIVVAPLAKTEYFGNGKDVSSLECKSNKDLQVAYDWIFLSSQYNPYKISIDQQKKIGIAGHSSGAHHIPSLLQTYPYIKAKTGAVLFSHGGRDIGLATPPLSHGSSDELGCHQNPWCSCNGCGLKSTLNNISTLFVTSAEDKKVPPLFPSSQNPKGSVLDWFDLAPSSEEHPKLFVELTHGNHGEPHGYKPKNKKYTYQFSGHMASFFSCHFYKEHCDTLKNSCTAKGVETEHCYGF